MKDEKWHSHLGNIKNEAAEELSRQIPFAQLYALYAETQTPQMKALTFLACALIAKRETRGDLPFIPLKDLYSAVPIHHEAYVWLTTAMHIAKDVPPEWQGWLNSRACPNSGLPHGFAWE